MKRIISAITLLLMLHCSAAFGEVRYSIIDLGTFGGDTSKAYSINNKGQITGFASTGSVNHAFLWEGGVMRDLTPSNTIGSSGRDINDSGYVVGSYDESPTITGKAFLYDGEVRIIGNVERWSGAEGINNKGQIVGYMDVHDPIDGIDHAFLWENEVMRDLRTLGGAESWALSINDTGWVVGYSDGYPYGGAFLFRDGVMEYLDGGGAAFSVNNQGQVVGYSGTHLGDRAFLWLDGVMQNLGTLSYTDASYAYDINERGHVVGSAWRYSPRNEASFAVLWQNGALTDLNTVIQPDSGWNLEFAESINDSGQIVGWGSYNGYTRAFLLNPVPEPSSILTLLCGMGGLVGTVLKRRR